LGPLTRGDEFLDHAPAPVRRSLDQRLALVLDGLIARADPEIYVALHAAIAQREILLSHQALRRGGFKARRRRVPRLVFQAHAEPK